MTAALLLPPELLARPVFDGQLLTLARFLRVVELAAKRPALGGVIHCPWSDWLALLDCTDEQLRDFFARLQRACLLSLDAEGVVSVLEFDQLVPQPPAFFLFTDAQQVANWCALELSMPGRVLDDADTRQLFRRWVATNVTREELEQAAARASDAHNLSPAMLHEQLLAIRKERLEKARQP